MQALDLITTIQNLIVLSPLRNDQIVVPLNYSTDETEKIAANLQLLADKCQTPLKLVLMGEVKSGKSTLLNALAGGTVAPTDVTETTAAIMTITYGESAEAAIYTTAGNHTTGTPAEIFAILGEHQNDQDYFGGVDHVEVKLPLRPLKTMHIVDTPGLMTITTTNAARTENFFQQADVVLWVLNAHYLGQSDVNEELERVADMGKPIIGVLNRIDEMEGDTSKLVRYVKRELGIFLEDVFPLSAKQAFDAVQSQDMEGQQASGFTDLMHYLEHNVERHADVVQNESLVNSAKAILARELLLHQAILADVDSKLLLVRRSHEKMEQQSEYIKNKQECEVETWFNKDFLADKEQLLQQKIQQMSLTNMGSSTAELKRCIQEYFSEASIRAEIDAFLLRLDENVRNDWQERLHIVQEQVSDEYNEMLRSYHVQAQNILDKLPDASSTALSGAGQGAMAAGVFGGAMAAYTAWLGPAAAHVSIGAALGSVMPPLLLAGAVTGAVMGLVKYKNIRSGYTQMVAQSVDKIRRDVQAKVLPGIHTVINHVCTNVVEGCHQHALQENFEGHDEEEMSALRNQLEQYTKLLESHLSNQLVEVPSNALKPRR